MSPRADPQHRLLGAVTELAGRHGYAHLTVQRLLEHAGVSRATFYQYFSNVEDAFSSAYRLHAEDLVGAVTDAACRAVHPQQAMLMALIDIAQSRPNVAALLLAEGLAAGSVGLCERDALISRIQDAVGQANAQQEAIDLPGTVLIGATFRLLSMKLASGAPPDVRAEVRRWTTAFERSPSQLPWSTRFIPKLPADSPRSHAASPVSPRDGPPRERILQATAATIHRDGYGATSVADIVKVAGVSRRSFYNAFPSRAAAFMAAYEFGFQQTMAACAPAFFKAETWPEKVWQSASAFTSFFARHPSFAYLGFVECHALGRSFDRRIAETQLAFTLFLEGGYRQTEDAPIPLRTSSALTAAALTEIGFLASRSSPSLYIRRMQPLAVYIALTPFIGSDQAGRFVAEKVSATGLTSAGA